MINEQIRPLALGIVWRGDDLPKERVAQRQLLVFEGYNRATGETFYRPLGGGIKFGERSQEALRREFREELGVELVGVRYLATLENIFTCNDQRGHEIIMLYEATLADRSLHERETLEVHEEEELLTAYWIPLQKFQTDGLPLYPDGLFELLTGADTRR